MYGNAHTPALVHFTFMLAATTMLNDDEWKKQEGAGRLREVFCRLPQAVLVL